MNYYNDNDSFIAKWLRELIKAGLIPKGYVDERSITEIDAESLRAYTQCHFFAGIGGWSYALQLANYPTDEPVWTGSCPCQPLSCAGKQKGHEDERHLWPIWYKLIKEFQPSTIFGEQISSKLGREWLAGLRLDLESLGYAVGAADLPAACVSAPHKRNRLFWVAYSEKLFGIERNLHEGSDREFQKIISKPGNRNSTTVWDELRWPCDLSRVCTEPDGLPGRVGLLRGSGNAIVPQVAAEFIKSFRESIK